MSELTRVEAKKIITSRTVIGKPGKYQVKTTSVHFHNGKYICNFNAMNEHQDEKASELYHAGDFQDAVNTNLSYSVFEGNWIPSKSEYVNIQVGKVELKNKETNELTGETALLVVGLFEVAVSEGRKSRLDDDEHETTEATANAEFAESKA